MATGPGDEAGEAPNVRPGWLDRPHPARLAPASPGYRAAIEAHDRAVAAGQPGYLDPGSGLFVMTAVYLHRRAWCCDRGCRHCPYVGAATATGEAPR